MILTKYFKRFNTKVPSNFEPTSPIKVVPKFTLSDNRKHITTDKEKYLLDSCVLVHNIGDYRRKITSMLLPNIRVSIDCLLWDRKELGACQFTL